MNRITGWLVLFGLIGMLTGCAKLFPMVDGAGAKLVIDSIVPTQGAAGQPVLIYGSGFSANPSGDRVYFNGEAAVMDTVASFHVLKVFAPAGGKTGNITLAAGGDSVSGPVFTYVPAPVISDVIYNNTFIISGQHFDPQLSVVTVSGQTIPGFVYNSQGGQESLVITPLLLNDQMANPAPVVVTVRNVASNTYPYLFYPQMTRFMPDTAHTNATTTIRGLLFGDRSVPSTLRAYYYDPNQRKTYMSPDPAILSWTTNTIQASIPDYRRYGSLLVGNQYFNIYLEVSVSTKVVSQGLYYSVR
ncbi:MAG TPA: IPT/TIG domain-containing protein [Puia sp.]|jgi:hypothetical protein